MALINIPITSTLADFKFTVILDNSAYDITMQWNGRDESWMLFLGRQGNIPRFKTKMRTGYDLLKEFSAYEDVPQGMLLVLDLNKSYGRMQRDSFTSGRMVLVYLTEDSKQVLEDLKFKDQDIEFSVRADLDGRFTIG